MSTSDIAIRAKGLGKQYRLGPNASYPRLTEVLAEWATPWKRRAAAAGPSEFWALKDIDFEIRPGEAVGLIGRNGAGKSTLLKILSRITDPSAGEVEFVGRVGSLLEVGTGFHPDLSGRENIFLNGSILGMNRGEIRKHFDAIVDFAEIEKFLDSPVKHYSSGMYMRLAFAVAAHLQPEILLVDEVLAVGDINFQRKCLGKMRDVTTAGRTVVFVSHNMASVQHFCQRCILLDDGRLLASGEVNTVISEYLSRGAPRNTSLGDRQSRRGNGKMRALRLELLNDAGEPIPAILPGIPFRFRLDCQVLEEIMGVAASIDVDTFQGMRVTTLFSGFLSQQFNLTPGPVSLDCRVEGIYLRPGTYSLNIYLAHQTETIDFVPGAAVLEVADNDFYGTGRLPGPDHGMVLPRYQWSAHATDS